MMPTSDLTDEQLRAIERRHEECRTCDEAIMAREIRRSRGAARDLRQAKIFAWTQQAFTEAQATSLPQRGLRLLEEAIEAFQAAGGDIAMAHKLVDYVFSRPVGVLHQELGGVGVCILALAAASGLSADEEERREVDRVLAKPIAEFRRRNAAKNAAGFLAVAPRLEDGGEPRNRQTLGPHATQQGAATPGQDNSPAAGNVAEPQLGPTPDRAECPPSSPYTGSEIVHLVSGWLADAPDKERFTLTRAQLASCLGTMLVPVRQ